MREGKRQGEIQREGERGKGSEMESKECVNATLQVFTFPPIRMKIQLEAKGTKGSRNTQLILAFKSIVNTHERT